MNKAFQFFANKFLSLSGYAVAVNKTPASMGLTKETAKVISLQHYIVFKSIDKIQREEDPSDIQTEAIIISFS